MLSADHYILRDPDRLHHTKIKSEPSDMFSGKCIYIYHDRGYMRMKHQVSIHATETVKEKPTFEREAKSQGVARKRYHTDNGIFNVSEFM